MFKSDFGVVARFFVNKRRDPEHAADDKTIVKHVDEVLKLLSVMTGDRRYEEILARPELTKGVSSMCNVAQILENKGIEKGRAEGRNLIVETVSQLRKGETPERLKADGFDQETIDLAQAIR